MEQRKAYTKEEYKKIVTKGRGFLMDYLREIGSGAFSSDLVKKNLFQVMSDEYRRLMKEDEAFFRKVEAFCSERRFRDEKVRFCREILTEMVSSGEIHRNYSRRTMEIDALPIYHVPKHHQN